MKTREMTLTFTFTADKEGNVGRVSGICGSGGEYVNEGQLFLAAYEMYTGKKVNIVWSYNVLERHIKQAIKEMENGS